MLRGTVFILALAVCYFYIFAERNHAALQNTLAARYSLTNLPGGNGWRLTNKGAPRTTRAVVCLHGMFSDKTEFAAFAPVILDSCRECAVYLLDSHFFDFTIPHLHEDRKILLGMSHGAAKAIELGFSDHSFRKFDKVAALAPFSSMGACVEEKLKFKLPSLALPSFIKNLFDGRFVNPERVLTNAKKIKSPPRLLLVHGKRDMLVQWENSNRLKSAYPEATLATVPNAWHVPRQLWGEERLLQFLKN